MVTVALPQDATLILCSTVPASYAQSVASELQSCGRGDIHFIDAPVSGGAKITESRSVSIRDTDFLANVYAGVWFDVYAVDPVVEGGTFRGNTGAAIQVELSTGAPHLTTYAGYRDSIARQVMVTNLQVWDGNGTRPFADVDILAPATASGANA